MIPMKTLTINNTTYEIVDDQARTTLEELLLDDTGYVKSVNGTTPDETGNVEIAIPEGGTVTDEQIAQAVSDYLQENPIEPPDVSGYVKSVNGQTPDENGNVEIAIPDIPQNVNGLTTEQITALNDMFKVCAFIKADISTEYNAFCTAFGITDSGEDSGGSGEEEPDEPVTPEVTLSSISAVYSGGDVTAGTTVTELTGIVVTAHYSDGTSEAVTGYTLSGTIAEGSNTITVTYQGMTATFTVTGVAESGGEETGVSNETTWTNGVDYTFTMIANEYPNKNTGVITTYSGWGRTPYLYCQGASKLRVSARVDTNMQQGCADNAFYDADKNYAGTFTYAMGASVTAGTYIDIDIPENAAYFILSGGSSRMNDASRTIILTPYE